MKVAEKILVSPCPPGATTAYEFTYYWRETGLEMVRLRFLDVSDDIFDAGSLSFSRDNGRTWDESRPHLSSRKTTEGTLRRFEGLGFVDPGSGLLLTLYLEGLFTLENSHEGMSGYRLHYRVSADGGRTAMLNLAEATRAKQNSADHHTGV
jgi:hypothetical protein